MLEYIRINNDINDQNLISKVKHMRKFLQFLQRKKRNEQN